MIVKCEMGDRSQTQTYPVSVSKITDRMPFAVNGIGEFQCDGKYYTSRKGRTDGLMIYTLAGKGIIRYEGREFLVQPGEMVVLDCRKYHYYGTREDSWHFVWIHFGGRCAFDYIDMLNTGEDILIRPTGYVSVQKYFDQIVHNIVHKKQHAELENAAVLHRMMTDLIEMKQNDTFSRKFGRYRENMDDVIVWLQEHSREEISLEYLAERCHLSKHYFIKIFKAYTGQTPYDYLLGLRLNDSKRLLLETELSVEEIGTEAGLGESKNFIACFKKRIGLTPLQYRKQNTMQSQKIDTIQQT